MEARHGTNEVARIIFHVVDALELGKHKLASFLKGSRSKEIAHIANENVFGGLFWYNISTIEGFIEQLEHMKLIERKIQQGYPYPYSVYVLTDSGRRAMNENIDIPLQEVKKEKLITVGWSEKQTFELFKQGKTINEIAKERNLAESTIYTHFYRLIINEYLQSSDVVPKDVRVMIAEVCTKFEKQPPLKEIKKLLPPEIMYEQIRCIVAECYRGTE